MRREPLHIQEEEEEEEEMELKSFKFAIRGEMERNPEKGIKKLRSLGVSEFSPLKW